MDQAFIAGLGNLLVDEVLWRAALAPNRPGTSITDAELRVLHKTIRPTVVTMLKRGGSHLGDVIDDRHSNGRCPLDGATMIKGSLAGAALGGVRSTNSDLLRVILWWAIGLARVQRVKCKGRTISDPSSQTGDVCCLLGVSTEQAVFDVSGEDRLLCACGSRAVRPCRGR